MISIIENWGWKYIDIYMNKIEELGIKLDKSVAIKLSEIWYLTLVINHRNVFTNDGNRDKSEKWSFIIPPSDTRNFRWQ